MNKKFTVFFLFVAGTCILWFIHAMSSVQQTTLPVYIVYKNYVYAEGDPSGRTAVAVRIQGKGYELFLWKRKFTNAKIPLDINNLIKSSNTPMKSLAIEKIINDFFVAQGEQIQILKTEPEKIEFANE